MSAGRLLPRRCERLVAVCGRRRDRARHPTAVGAATPSLSFSSVIHTNPFAGTSTRMHDGEGSAYVARDDSLWLADDNSSSVFEVNRATGALKRVISGSQFEGAPGSAAAAGRPGSIGRATSRHGVRPRQRRPVRVLREVLHLLGAADRLPPRRGSDHNFRVESYQPLPSGSDFTAAAFTASDGKLYVASAAALRQYTYASNSVGSTFQVSGLSGILGMSFSDDGADL